MSADNAQLQFDQFYSCVSRVWTASIDFAKLVTQNLSLGLPLGEFFVQDHIEH